MKPAVQATCPGCKKVLRIPADWIYRPMKCKNCGLTFQAKKKPAGTPTSVGAKGASAGIKAADGQRRGNSPAANPVRANSNPFAQLDAPGTIANPAKATPVSGTLLKGMILGFGVLAVAATLFLVFWDQLLGSSQKEKTETDQHRVAVVESGKKAPDILDPGKKPPVDSSKKSLKDPEKKPPVDPGKKPPLDKGRKPPVDPGKKPPVDPGKKPPVVVDPPSRPAAFPRRALVVSVNNYLYLNPISYGSTTRDGRNVKTVMDRMGKTLRIPNDQMLQLSDAAPTDPRPPLKPVIEQTVKDFMATCRAQDRVLLMFIGHVVEIGEEPYLVPVEGQQEVKETLIPVEWVYKQLSYCKARQKVLILDVCRLNPARGQERPGSGVMGPKLEAKLKDPPPGVQVWSSCVAEQNSYEIGSNGLFQDQLYEVLVKGLEGTVQQPEEPFPLPQMVETVNNGMKAELDKIKKVQTSRLTGQEPSGGAPYNDKEAPAPPVVIQLPPEPPGGLANPNTIKAVLKEVEVPPVKSTLEATALKYESLPFFSNTVMEAYKDDGAEKTPFREAVIAAKNLLNSEIKGKRLEEQYKAPDNENQFKDRIKAYQAKQVATVQGKLEEARDQLKKAGELRDSEKSKHWQANYDYILARLEMQIAFLYEYNSLLGSMRQKLPDKESPEHNGWQAASQTTLQGDPVGQKLAASSQKILQKLATDHPGTPWEVLAKRDSLTALGLEWKSTKITGGR